MRSYEVARVWDIPIKIHVSLVVVLPILAVLIGSGKQIEVYALMIEGLSGAPLPLEPLLAGRTPWLVGSLAAIGLFVSVALHELGHAWMALRYDLEVESITLWLLGGLANLGSIPREWEKEFWIAIAGPAVSLATAIACYVALLALPAGAPILTFVVGWLAVTNVVLTVFNLLPAFPMDGGRILRALLARNRSYLSATRAAARIGSLFAILFAVVGVTSFSPMLVLLGLFVYVAATGESRAVQLAELLEGETVGSLAPDGDAIDGGDSVASLIDRMVADGRTAYAVDDDGRIGVVSGADLKDVAGGDRATTRIAERTRHDLPRLAADLSAFEGLTTLDRTGASAAIVEDADGSVRLLTRDDFGRALDVRRLVASGEPF